MPLEMSQRQLAEHIKQDVKVINRIVNGRSAVTAEVALKLAATFRTTPEFWLNAQKAVDLYLARKKVGELPKALVAPSRAIASTAFGRHQERSMLRAKHSNA